jgi:hypothetical protein
MSGAIHTNPTGKLLELLLFQSIPLALQAPCAHLKELGEDPTAFPALGCTFQDPVHGGLRIARQRIRLTAVILPERQVRLSPTSQGRLRQQEYDEVKARISSYYDSVSERIRCFTFDIVPAARQAASRAAMQDLGRKCDASARALLQQLHARFVQHERSDLLSLYSVFPLLQDDLRAWEEEFEAFIKAHLAGPEVGARGLPTSHQLRRLFLDGSAAGRASHPAVPSFAPPGAMLTARPDPAHAGDVGHALSTRSSPGPLWRQQSLRLGQSPDSGASPLAILAITESGSREPVARRSGGPPRATFSPPEPLWSIPLEPAGIALGNGEAEGLSPILPAAGSSPSPTTPEGVPGGMMARRPLSSVLAASLPALLEAALPLPTPARSELAALLLREGEGGSARILDVEPEWESISGLGYVGDAPTLPGPVVFAEVPTSRQSLMQTIASLWTGNVANFRPLVYPFRPSEHVFPGSCVLVREEEPTSLIAHTLW